MKPWMLALLAAVLPAQAADNAVERALNKAGKAIERGAKAAGRGVDRGARATQKGAAKVHKKVDERVRPEKK
ncbi:MAG: hypothetical protein ACREVD_00935 [Burkholderiales bacterium]